MISKKDVPEHRPEIPVPYIFKKDEKLKRFLLSKLINAEYACLSGNNNSEKLPENSIQKLVNTLTINSASFMSMTKSSSSSSLTANSSLTTSSSSSRLNVLSRIRKFSSHHLKTEK